MVLPETFSVKIKFSDYLKENDYHFYFSPDLEASLNVVFRGLSKSTDPVAIKNSLNADGVDVIQLLQMKNRKDGRIIPLFLQYLPRNEKSKRNFNFTTLYKIRVQV